MDINFVDNYINQKLAENDKFIKYTFYELRIKRNLSKEDTKEFLRLNQVYFEQKNYLVYYTGDEFLYNNEIIKVKPNELMIIVKK